MAKRNWNVSSMTLAELLGLRTEIERAVRDKIDSEQSELRARLEELSSLQSGPSRRVTGVNGTVRKGRRSLGRAHPLKGRKVAAKYRGPEGQTWSGRGLAPRWLAELERRGKKRDSYLIQ
jgi:DNA-binding protein H-NS